MIARYWFERFARVPLDPGDLSIFVSQSGETAASLRYAREHEQHVLSVVNVPSAPCDRVFNKTVSNMQEVAARGGRLILVTDAEGASAAADQPLVTLTLPTMPATVTPLVYAVPVQLIAYHTAIIMGTRCRSAAQSGEVGNGGIGRRPVRAGSSHKGHRSRRSRTSTEARGNRQPDRANAAGRL
jgi:glucosamine 6-phosphate synthetase-like amidotransferase/phosphosugar isomerase protein